LKTCPECRFWQQPDAVTCEMCGASFDAPVIDPLAPTWEEPQPAATAPTKSRRDRTANPRSRRDRTGSPKRRPVVMAGIVAGVLLVGLAGLTWYRNRPADLKWSTQPSPLGLATLKEAGECRSFAPSADEDVAVGGRLCSIDDGVSLVVVEFDFRSRDLSKVEPRFLAESLMQGADGVQTGALDTFTPAASTTGTVGEFTGRAIVSGQEVKTVGRIIESGNRGLMLMGAAVDRDDVTDAFQTMASSVALAATPPAS
jgi:hypothetical protein